MKVAIVEDEAMAARRLQRLAAAELGEAVETITLLDTLDEAVAFVSNTSVDLLLLDLDLSGKDGFDVLRKVPSSRPDVIVVSANVDRALEAFDHDVVDFVPKPVTAERLARALKRAKGAAKGEKRLTVRSQGKTDIVAIKSITHFSGADDYVEVHTSAGECFLHYERLDVLERTLPDNFLRIHRSHIANLEYVKTVQTGQDKQCYVVLRNDEHIPVSRRRVKLLKAAIS